MSAISAHSSAHESSIDSSIGQIIGGGRAGARPATKHASCRTRLIRGPTIQQRRELLAKRDLPHREVYNHKTEHNGHCTGEHNSALVTMTMTT